MMQTILVGIAAGIAAALMFLAPIGGTVLAFPLFILTGLPVGLAGLGWGVRAGAVAVVAGTLAILVALQALAAAAFLLLFAAPAFWVARLALRSRPGATPEAPREWYPLGSMLVHLAIAVAIGVVIVGILIGFDRATMAGEITQALVELFSTMRTTGTPPTPAELTPFVAVLPRHHAVQRHRHPGLHAHLRPVAGGGRGPRIRPPAAAAREAVGRRPAEPGAGRAGRRHPHGFPARGRAARSRGSSAGRSPARRR